MYDSAAWNFRNAIRTVSGHVQTGPLVTTLAPATMDLGAAGRSLQRVVVNQRTRPAATKQDGYLAAA